MPLSEENKYFFYEKSVQGPEFDIDFIERVFHKTYGKNDKNDKISLREDFAGTGYLCCDWVKRGNGRTAVAVDLDPDPINYGKKTHYSRLSENQKERVLYLNQDVTQIKKIKSNIIVAFNFSYFIFKEREQLLKYFKSVRKSLDKKGLFFLDILGGSDCFLPNTTTIKHPTHHYLWELSQFNPINHHIEYFIHFFDKKNKKLHKKVFHYDWRLWSIPEIKDLLKEAGFSHSSIYWEGDDQKGGGNGHFKKTARTEFCQSWVSYIVAS